MNRVLIVILIGVSVISCKVDPEVSETVIVPSIKNAPYDLDVPTEPYLGSYVVPDSNPTTIFGVQLGRKLFYEKKLSGDNTMACASCHQQEHAFSEPKAVSTGIDGISGNRSAMPIQNLLWDNAFFWDGRSKTLEDQALHPIKNPIELNQSIETTIDKLKNDPNYPKEFMLAFEPDMDTVGVSLEFAKSYVTKENLAKAIAQFERSLISSNSKFDRYMRQEVSLTPAELRGLSLMVHPDPNSGLRGGNCSDCHQGFLFNNRNDVFMNNGLDQVIGSDPGLQLITGRMTDRGKFKIPSLRNVAVTAPYMHDGRFATLEEVLDHYNSAHIRTAENVDNLVLGGSNIVTYDSLGLTEQEKQDIIAFLHTLTDSTFLTDEKFSSPFE